MFFYDIIEKCKLKMSHNIYETVISSHARMVRLSEEVYILTEYTLFRKTTLIFVYV